jgi:MFS family permease
VASLEGLMHALYLVWWVEEKQLSPAVVAAILAFGDLALMMLELPTGWFADRFGHRRSLIAGSMLQVCGMLCCWLGEGVAGLTAASVLVASGDAFRSGAEQALLYRSCVAARREHAFQSIEARSQAAEAGALVGLILVGGGIVTTWGFGAGWLAETALCGFGALLACAMREPPPADADRREPDAQPSASLFSRRLLLLVVPAAFVGALAAATLFLAQLAGDTRPLALTFVVAAAAIADACGSLLASQAVARALNQWLLAGAGFVIALVPLGAPATLTAAAIGLAFLAGLIEPIRATAVQRIAADGVRARAASLASACDMAFSTVVLPLAGVLRSRR